MNKPVVWAVALALIALATLLLIKADELTRWHEWARFPAATEAPTVTAREEDGVRDPALAADETSRKEAPDDDVAMEEGIAPTALVDDDDSDLSLTDEPAADEAVSAIIAAEPVRASEPSFDIVRVEEDGTAVIAGRAPVDAMVTVMIDGEAVGSTETNQRGEWVVILEQPIGPGDHVISALAEVEGEEPTASRQTVAISLAEDSGEQPVIVASEPGRPSRVIQLPPAADDETVREPVPAEDDVAALPDDVAKEDEGIVDAVEDITESTPEGEAVAAAPEESLTEEEIIAALPDIAAEERGAVREEEDVTTATHEADVETRPVETQPETDLVYDDVLLSLQTIDYNNTGDMIFSGAAAPGATVRIYVDNTFLADVAAGPGGRWIFSGRDAIAPGVHLLRLDQIDRDGRVAQRIEVPFERATDAQIAQLMDARRSAAEARSRPEAAKVEDGAGETFVREADEEDERPAQHVAREEGEEERISDPRLDEGAGEIAQTDEAAPGREPEEERETRVAAVEPPIERMSVDEDPPMREMAAADREPAATAEDRADVPARDEEPVSRDSEVPASEEQVAVVATTKTPDVEKTDKIGDRLAKTEDRPPLPDRDAPRMTGEHGEPETTVAETADEPFATPPAAADLREEAPTVRAADEAEAIRAETEEAPSDMAAVPVPDRPDDPLHEDAAPKMEEERVVYLPPDEILEEARATGEGFVVIQPGNNLWTISRVIYGRGIEYTVIYQANRAQIRDPDLIYPGQIFTTPGVKPPEYIPPEIRTPLEPAEPTVPSG